MTASLWWPETSAKCSGGATSPRRSRFLGLMRKIARTTTWNYTAPNPTWSGPSKAIWSGRILGSIKINQFRYPRLTILPPKRLRLRPSVCARKSSKSTLQIVVHLRNPCQFHKLNPLQSLNGTSALTASQLRQWTSSTRPKRRSWYKTSMRLKKKLKRSNQVTSKVNRMKLLLNLEVELESGICRATLSKILKIA